MTTITAPVAAIWHRVLRLLRLAPRVGDYTAADWAAEMAALHAHEGLAACPRCRRSGFYGPREADDGRRYRACKFCGLWQNVGKSPHPIIRFECHVADWKEPHESWDCPSCGRHFEPSEAVAWPAANPAHPWWAVPQGMSYDAACDYFAQHFGRRQPHG